MVSHPAAPLPQPSLTPTPLCLGCLECAISSLLSRDGPLETALALARTCARRLESPLPLPASRHASRTRARHLQPPGLHPRRASRTRPPRPPSRVTPAPAGLAPCLKNAHPPSRPPPAPAGLAPCLKNSRPPSPAPHPCPRPHRLPSPPPRARHLEAAVS